MQSFIRLNKPARHWEDGLPLGNGRLGAMVMGKTDEETIFINEETLWYGPARDRKNPDALAHLQQVRELLLRGEVQKAQFIAKMAFTSTPKYVNPYQPAGDLRICFLDHRHPVENYSRTLDIDHALTRVEYGMQGNIYRRELFVSHKYNVLAVRFTCSKPGGLTLSANISRKPFEERTAAFGQNTAANWGQCGEGGVRYYSAVRLAARGGTVDTMGDFVYAWGTDEVVLYLSSGTDFGGRQNYREQCLSQLDKAQQAGYESIKNEHIMQYRSLYDRVELDLNGCELPDRTTAELLEELRQGRQENGSALCTLLFNYARYLMIGSSYGCMLPANLQGIWNGSYTPPWESKFTININTQMNYWMVEGCNLPECHLPLFRLLDRLVENGRKTAEQLYGCRGFCAHHNTNLWANTDPEGIFDASPLWPMGGAWLSLHLYEHFLYTGDRTFLKGRALPVMREAVLFFEDYLYEYNGRLLTGPSLSPENTYISSIGQKGSLCMAPTMDIEILRQLFTWFIEGCETAGENPPEKEAAQDMLKKLPETKISSDGRIMEWQQEYAEAEPGHRHISHLYGLHPGNEITQQNPQLFRAAEKTLETRLANGGGHTGWSLAWIICFYARLLKGDKAYEKLTELLGRSMQDNLLDLHPPFQIDGNFGAADAILEMLVQSHNSYIEILPALPFAWRSGSLRGACLRGAVQADIYWQNGRLEKMYLTAKADRSIKIKYGNTRLTVALQGGCKTKVEL